MGNGYATIPSFLRRREPTGAIFRRLFYGRNVNDKPRSVVFINGGWHESRFQLLLDILDNDYHNTEYLPIRVINHKSILISYTRTIEKKYYKQVSIYNQWVDYIWYKDFEEYRHMRTFFKMEAIQHPIAFSDRSYDIILMELNVGFIQHGHKTFQELFDNNPLLQTVYIVGDCPNSRSVKGD